MEGLDWSSQPFQCGCMCEVGLSGLFQREEKSCLHFLTWAVHIIDFFVSIAEMKIQRGKKSLVWICLNLGLFPRQNKSPALRRAVSECFVSPEMSVHTVLAKKAVEMQGLVHQTQLWKAKVSSFSAGDSWCGEYVQHETNSFHSHFWFKGTWLHLALLPGAMPGGLRAVLDGRSGDVFSLSCRQCSNLEQYCILLSILG